MRHGTRTVQGTRTRGNSPLPHVWKTDGKVI
jgi:hypothetical protein